MQAMEQAVCNTPLLGLKLRVVGWAQLHSRLWRRTLVGEARGQVLAAIGQKFDDLWGIE